MISYIEEASSRRGDSGSARTLKLTAPPPKRTGDEILKDYMPMIEADRRRSFG
jgi:hypothetical protein